MKDWVSLRPQAPPPPCVRCQFGTNLRLRPKPSSVRLSIFPSPGSGFYIRSSNPIQNPIQHQLNPNPTDSNQNPSPLISNHHHQICWIHVCLSKLHLICVSWNNRKKIKVVKRKGSMACLQVIQVSAKSTRNEEKRKEKNYRPKKDGTLQRV